MLYIYNIHPQRDMHRSMYIELWKLKLAPLVWEGNEEELFCSAMARVTEEDDIPEKVHAWNEDNNNNN